MVFCELHEKGPSDCFNFSGIEINVKTNFWIPLFIYLFLLETEFRNCQKPQNGHEPDFRQVGHIGRTFGQKFYWSKKSRMVLSADHDVVRVESIRALLLEWLNVQSYNYPNMLFMIARNNYNEVQHVQIRLKRPIQDGIGQIKRVASNRLRIWWKCYWRTQITITWTMGYWDHQRWI